MKAFPKSAELILVCFRDAWKIGVFERWSVCGINWALLLVEENEHLRGERLISRELLCWQQILLCKLWNDFTCISYTREYGFLKSFYWNLWNAPLTRTWNWRFLQRAVTTSSCTPWEVKHEKNLRAESLAVTILLSCVRYSCCISRKLMAIYPNAGSWKPGLCCGGTGTRCPLLVPEPLAGLPQLRPWKKPTSEGGDGPGTACAAGSNGRPLPSPPLPSPARGRLWERRPGPARSGGRAAEAGRAPPPLRGGGGRGRRRAGRRWQEPGARRGRPARAVAWRRAAAPAPAEEEEEEAVAALSAAGQVRERCGRGAPPGRAGGTAPGSGWCPGATRLHLPCSFPPPPLNTRRLRRAVDADARAITARRERLPRARLRGPGRVRGGPARPAHRAALAKRRGQRQSRPGWPNRPGGELPRTRPGRPGEAAAGKLRLQDGTRRRAPGLGAAGLNAAPVSGPGRSAASERGCGRARCRARAWNGLGSPWEPLWWQTSYVPALARW